jgi:tripartite-type tricarboxylate transporter receptor subunit TctC
MDISRRFLLITTASLVPCAKALAQGSYPQHPIKIVAPFTAGAGADTLLRKVSEAAGRLIGQPMVVDNKPGAQAAIASRIVARAPNDGYTLMMGGNSSHAANVHTLKNPGYDPLKDFSPITQLSLNPLLLVVNAERPVRTVQEFIKYATERPGKLTYATGNSGMLVAAQRLKTQAGIDALAVNYPGAAPATTDLLAGRIDFIMNDPVVAAPFIKSGQLRVLGVTSKQRLSMLPDVAPLAEQGLPDYDYASWSAMFAPVGWRRTSHASSTRSSPRPWPSRPCRSLRSRQGSSRSPRRPRISGRTSGTRSGCGDVGPRRLGWRRPECDSGVHVPPTLSFRKQGRGVQEKAMDVGPACFRYSKQCTCARLHDNVEARLHHA